MIRSLSAQITSIFSMQHGSPSLVIALAGGGGGGGKWYFGETHGFQEERGKISHRQLKYWLRVRWIIRIFQSYGGSGKFYPDTKKIFQPPPLPPPPPLINNERPQGIAKILSHSMTLFITTSDRSSLVTRKHCQSIIKVTVRIFKTAQLNSMMMKRS